MHSAPVRFKKSLRTRALRTRDTICKAALRSNSSLPVDYSGGGRSTNVTPDNVQANSEMGLRPNEIAEDRANTSFFDS